MITFHNKHLCYDHIFKGIQSLVWKAGELDDSIMKNFPDLVRLYVKSGTSLRGLRCCTKITYLHCESMKLASLEGLENCRYLEELKCSNVQLESLVGLEKCTKLVSLICTSNQLESLVGIPASPVLSILDCRNNSLICLDGIEGCTNLKKLKCGSNKLTNIDALRSCSQLQKIICNNNLLTDISGLADCRMLKYADLSHNQLTSLVGINSRLLTKLFVNNNKLKTLGGLESVVSLHELNCNFNALVSLKGIEKCQKLVVLNCTHNSLTTLESLDNCSFLEKIYCSNNKLKSLEGIGKSQQLNSIICSHNEIIRLDNIVYLRSLRFLDCNDNPLENQTIQVQRFMDRLDQIMRDGNGFYYSTIYTNGQNIHDTNIQRTVCDSISKLLLDSRPDFNIEDIKKSPLSQTVQNRLIEYCEDDTVHSIHLLSYFELLSYVWMRIEKSEHREELFKILEEQIRDSEDMCFTGRFNRTLSALVGFYDDIQINISDGSRIGGIIVAIGKTIDPYNPQNHRTLAQKSLKDAGYTSREIKHWIDAITIDDV